MTGLSSVCSHVSALLFKVEAVVYHKVNQPVACTSQLCAWRSCKKNANPAHIKEICFKRGNKHDLPSVTSSKLKSFRSLIAKQLFLPAFVEKTWMIMKTCRKR